MTDKLFSSPFVDGRVLKRLQPAGAPANFPVAAQDSTTATASDEFVGPGAILFYATQQMHILFSKDGSLADGSDMLLPANTLLEFPIEAGDFVSVIAENTTGEVHIQRAKVI